MTAVVDAHRHLESFCQQNPGVAIGAELFTYLVKKAIDLANSRPIAFPTTTAFQGMKLGFAGSIDPAQMAVELDKKQPLPGDAPLPEISVQGLGFEVQILLGSTLMSTHRIFYRSITGGISVSANRIVIHGERSDGDWLPASEPWRNMATLPDGSAFTAELKEKWAVQEKAVQLIAKDLLGPALLESVELPNVIRMLTSISFVGPVRIGGEKNLIMFAGPAQWDIGCSRSPSALSPSSVLITKGADGQLDETGVDGEMNPNDPNGRYPRGPERPRLPDADVFVHLPKVFVEKRFDGVTKPAAGFNDDGHFGPIYWHYESAIIVQPPLRLSLTGLWPLEFKIELPSKGVGVAGAGVKIGCVYFEATGLAFNGDIDPLEIFFRIGQDTGRGELFFESRFGAVSAHGFQFHHWPVSKFPIDQIADFILARVTEMLLAAKVGEILDVTRFSLVDYSLLRGFGKMLTGMAAETSPAAVTVGVAFQK